MYALFTVFTFPNTVKNNCGCWGNGAINVGGHGLLLSIIVPL